MGKYLSLVVCIVVAAGSTSALHAQVSVEDETLPQVEVPPVPEPPEIQAEGYLLLDFASGRVLAEQRADTALEPASLTKLMTAYIVFGELAAGSLKLGDPVLVSEKAWRMRGSRMFIEVDAEVRVDDLIQGMIVQSGNDASIALAEHISGSEEAFVELMNAQAARLGLTRTVFRNTTGLPSRGHLSSARDIATLARALIMDFPEYYAWYSQREYTYNNIKQHNRNALLWRDDSVDGLKTGYTSRAGYCLASSAERSGMRLIAVVMGMKTPKARTAGSQALLNYGFESFETRKLFSRGQPVTAARVWKGEQAHAPLGVAQDLYVTIPRGQLASLSADLAVPAGLVAPVAANGAVGALDVFFAGRKLFSEPLVVLDTVPEGGLLTRLRDGFSLWLE